VIHATLATSNLDAQNSVNVKRCKKNNRNNQMTWGIMSRLVATLKMCGSFIFISSCVFMTWCLTQKQLYLLPLRNLKRCATKLF